MFTGLCKLTVDDIMLACRSSINSGNSNGSLHACNLLVMAWHCRDKLFFVIPFKIIIFSIVRELRLSTF